MKLNQRKQSKYNEEENIEEGKQLHVFCHRAAVSAILGKCNKACKRRNEGTRTADVDTEEQRFPDIGESRQQDSRRDVAYDLTRSDADEQRIYLHKTAQQLAYSRYTRHIAREDEECGECAEQRIIHGFQCLAV